MSSTKPAHCVGCGHPAWVHARYCTRSGCDCQQYVTSDRTEELRDAVIDAADAYRKFMDEPPGRRIVAHGNWLLDTICSASKALDDHLKPDPLRDAVALLRRALPIVEGAERLETDIEAFLAALDKDGAT